MQDFWARCDHPLYGQVQRSGSSAYRLYVHVLFTTPGRRRIFTEARIDCLLTVLRWTAHAEGIVLLKAALREDEVQLLLALSPQHSVDAVVQELKERAEATLFGRFPKLAEEVGRTLFAPGYSVDSVGCRTPTEADLFLLRRMDHVRSAARLWNASLEKDAAVAPITTKTLVEEELLLEEEEEEEIELLEVDEISMQAVLAGVET